MEMFVQGFGLPVSVGIVLAIIGIVIKKLNDKVDKAKKQQVELNLKLAEENQKREKAFQELVMNLNEGVLAILHDRLYQACSHYLSPDVNCISPSEMRNLDKMYKAYAKLGGNGQIKEMYERCMELRICFKEGESHETQNK